jgi:hypothetical protein
VKAEAACTPALVACVADSAEARERVTCRRLAPPLDACVCADVLSPAECADLRREAASMGFSFWHEDGGAGALSRLGGCVAAALTRAYCAQAALRARSATPTRWR